MLTQWLEAAYSGQPVWLPDVRQSCGQMANAVPVTMQLALFDGTRWDIPLPLPRWEGEAQRRFAAEYAAACIYNALSACSAQRVTFYLDLRETEAVALLGQVTAQFSLQIAGYGKVVQIARRLCRTFGAPPFSFSVEERERYTPAPPVSLPRGALEETLRRAVARCGQGLCCGIDIGGTDIKAVLARDGQLMCVKEFDWNPAASPTAEGIIAPVVLLVRLLCCCAAGITPALRRGLAAEASLDEIRAAVAESESRPLDVLGVSFPDIVLRDRIVGGETPKTQEMRRNREEDYEAAFARLGGLLDALRPLCRENAALHMTNDGHMAAFTAAVELAEEGNADMSGGVIAHALGTDFGMGLLLPDGTIPEVPMELYDFLLDLGSFPQRALLPEDLRSTRNENSGLPGARRYLGQAAAFRLAYDADPQLLAGFTVEEGGILTVPPPLRKPCLERLMTLAAQGDSAAASVFFRMGTHIGQISRELALLLSVPTERRYLFGRFVKHPACFRLLQEGCRAVQPELHLEAADEELALTPLMRQLRPAGVTVAQFGQAVGAVYYAAMQEKE